MCKSGCQIPSWIQSWPCCSTSAQDKAAQSIIKTEDALWVNPTNQMRRTAFEWVLLQHLNTCRTLRKVCINAWKEDLPKDKEANKEWLQACFVQRSFCSISDEDVSLVGYGEGSICEQKCKETLCPEAIQPVMLSHRWTCAEHCQFHFLVFFNSLPHTWPTCLSLCLDLDDIKKQQIQTAHSTSK